MSNRWQRGFLKMLPVIKRIFKLSFRHLRPEAREECIQEAVCNAVKAYHRLAELDKLDLAYPTVLARYAVAQVKDHRKVGGHLNIRDILSKYCQVNKNITVERLDKFNSVERRWEEIILEDRHATPADIVSTKLDFSAWLKTLSRRYRKIAQILASGENTLVVAKKFNLSAGRISQLRREFRDSWLKFLGEPIPAA
jgi:hypothetical protein